MISLRREYSPCLLMEECIGTAHCYLSKCNICTSFKSSLWGIYATEILARCTRDIYKAIYCNDAYLKNWMPSEYPSVTEWYYSHNAIHSSFKNSLRHSEKKSSYKNTPFMLPVHIWAPTIYIQMHGEGTGRSHVSLLRRRVGMWRR